jgi:hypothetical protein
MELHQLRCFVAVAEELHFGRAARRLDMLPSALGRHIRLLEESLADYADYGLRITDYGDGLRITVTVHLIRSTRAAAIDN